MLTLLAFLTIATQEPLELTPETFQAGELVYAADTGRLSVPENREREDSRTIHLAFVRLHSTADDPDTPLFYLPGGPGNAATPGAELPIWGPFLELGDVVLLDPRGVGRSDPDLTYASETIRSELFFSDRETAIAHMRECVQEAGDALGAAGVDLGGYDAVEMAEDLDALRQALGYEEIDLMAHSWGNVVGLELIRRHPSSVRRFASVGTAGPDELMKLPSQLDRSLRRLAEAVAADPVIGDEMPDLFEAFGEAVAELEREPLAVTIRDPRGGGAPLEVALGPFGFQLILVADLHDVNDMPVLPRLVHSVALRDPGTVRWFLERRVRQFAELPVLMLCARAASGASAARWETIRAEAKSSPFGLARCLFSPEADIGFGAIDLGDAARTPVRGQQPVLFVSGTLDAATPVEQAEGVRRGFPNSGHLIVENGGHEDLLSDPDVRAHIVAFLAGDPPTDARLEHDVPRFAPLEGPAPGFDHPALAR